MKDILSYIVGNNEIHAKWLNSLSFMENAGARKISACEHPRKVDVIQLKHAAEEHRHAYYLKKQIVKIAEGLCQTYTDEELISAFATRYYLDKLNIQCCRYLKIHFKLRGLELQYIAYLFVTYLIEVRADYLYPIYQEVLTEAKSPVTVKSIILEEEGHLEEMIHLLDLFDNDWQSHAHILQVIEQDIFDDWVSQITSEVYHAIHL